MQIIAAIVLIVAAIAFFFFILRQMLNAEPCPVCKRNEGIDEMLIPIVPVFYWFCPNCGSIIKNSKVGTRERPSVEPSED